MNSRKLLSLTSILAVGILVIFVSAMSPMYTVVADLIKNLNGVVFERSTETIEQKTSSVYLERVKRKAEEYRLAYSAVNKYTDVLSAYYQLMNHRYDFYKDKGKPLIEINKDDPRYKSFNFAYYGDVNNVPQCAIDQFNYSLMYFPLFGSIAHYSKFIQAVWIRNTPANFSVSYVKNVTLKKFTKGQSKSFHDVTNIPPGQLWSQIFLTASGKLVTVRTNKVYKKDDPKKYIGSVGINLDVGEMVKDFNQSVHRELQGIQDDSSSQEVFSFMLDNEYNIVMLSLDRFDMLGIKYRDLKLKDSVLQYNLKNTTAPGIKELIKQIDSESYGNVKYFYAGEKYIISFAHVYKNGWVVATVVPTNYFLKPLKIAQKDSRGVELLTDTTASIIIIIATICTFIITILIFRKHFQGPLNKVIKDVVQETENGFKKDIPKDGVLEVAGFANSFNNLRHDLNDEVVKLKNELEKNQEVETEISSATKIQKALMATNTKVLEQYNVDLQIFDYRRDKVSHKFYDFFFVSKNKFALLVGQTTDKGLSSAFYMTFVMAMIRGVCQSHNNRPEDAIKAINAQLCDAEKTNLFTSLALVYYDTSTGNFMYTNAGHQDLYKITYKGDIKQVDKNPGVMLPLDENFDYTSSENSLKDEEYLIMPAYDIMVSHDKFNKIIEETKDIKLGSEKVLINYNYALRSTFNQNEDIILLVLKKNKEVIDKEN